MEFYYATVISNQDPEELGRIQAKSEILHADCEDDLLPWAKQFSLSTGGSGDYGSSSIPEEGSLVWLWFPDRDDLKKPYYIADVQLKGVSPHKLFEDNVKSSITGFASSYPDVKFTYLKNGICFGASSGTAPEYFIFHPNGAFIYINSDGDIDIKDATGNEIKMLSTGIELNGNTKTFVTHTELNASLQTFVGLLNTALGSKLDGGGTPGVLTLDIASAATTTIKTGG